jgi:hypothetical protein
MPPRPRPGDAAALLAVVTVATAPRSPAPVLHGVPALAYPLPCSPWGSMSC